MNRKIGVVMLLVWVGLVGLYTLTRTQVHTFDALSYTQDVETKPFLELYHPHHLLYGGVGRLAVNLAEFFGYEGRADQPIQFLNALAGATSVIVLWGIGIHLTGRVWLSLLPALGMGFSYAFWFYAGEVEVYTFAVLFMVLTLAALLRLEKPHPSPPRKQGGDLIIGAVILGLAHAGAVMFHQTNSLFAVPVGLFLLVSPSLRRAILPYGFTLALAVGIPYLAVGYASGFRSVDAYYNWLTDYAQTGAWGGNLNGAGLTALREGLFDTVSTQPLWAAIFYGLAVVGFGLSLPKRSWGWRLFCVSWLGLYGGFFWWWEPWNIEFWIVLLPLWVLGMYWGMMVSSTNPLLEKLAPLGMTFMLAGLATNLTPIQQAGDPDGDYYRLMTQALAPSLLESDIVVTRGNILDLYLPFYAEHPAGNVISLRTQAGETLSRDLLHPYQRGQIIYLDQLILDEPQDGQRNPFGLSQAQIDHLYATFPIKPASFLGGEVIFYSIGERFPPETTDWDFSQHLGGWLEFGAENLRFENGGWCLTGGGDPWVESPPLQLNTEKYTHLEIDLELDTPAEYGQIFWTHAGEDLDESRSLKFPLQVGRQTYRLVLGEQPEWNGIITFLRFDPIPEQLSVTACLFRLRFTP